MSCNNSKDSTKSKDDKVFNMIADDARSLLEVLDLENEEEDETGSIDVFNIIPDDVRSRLGVLDLEEE